MILVCKTAGYVKKRYPGSTLQEPLEKALQTIVIDPNVSKIDLFVLSTRDVDEKNLNIIQSAINKKHQDIQVLFVSTDKKLELIGATNVQVPKITVDGVYQAIHQILQNVEIRQHEIQIISKDSIVPESEDLSINKKDTNKKESIPNEKKETFVEEQKVVELPLPTPLSEPITPLPEPITILPETKKIETPEPVFAIPEAIPVSQVSPTSVPESTIHSVRSSEEIIKHIQDLEQYQDWDYFKKQLDQDELVRELLSENAEFSGMQTMLEILEKKMVSVVRDISIQPEEKLEKLREMGIERSRFKAKANSVVADKLNNIIDLLVNVTDQVANKRIAEIKDELDIVKSNQNFLADKEKLRLLLNKRLELQAKLQDTFKDIIETYKVMDRSVNDFIKKQDEGLPSENNYINELLKINKPIFTPENVSSITTQLMADLEAGRTKLSAFETTIKALISYIIKLSEADEQIIQEQQNIIALLEAQRVEDIIIVDSSIKSATNIFIGPENSGVTATALIFASNMARRVNTIFIDFTGKVENRYNIPCIQLKEFLESSSDEPLVYIKAINENIEPEDMMTELKYRLDYYNKIIILLNEEQIDIAKKLMYATYIMHYVVESKYEAIMKLKGIIKKYEANNVAQKLVIIDPPEEPLDIVKKLEIDPFLFKLILIPHLSAVRNSTIKGIHPAFNSEVANTIDLAFR